MEISRSEQKRRIKQLEELVKELVKLPPGLLDQAPLPDEARELALEVAGLKGGARKRQIKYITKLLRREPVDPLYEFLTRRKGTELLKKKKFHEVEYWRDSLIEESIAAHKVAKASREQLSEDWQSSVVQAIVEELPRVDRIELTRLSCFFARSRNPKHSREIFRLLQAAQEYRMREPVDRGE